MEVADVHDGICTYRWTISDTGIGMSPEFLSHILIRFHRKKQMPGVFIREPVWEWRLPGD